ncbi:MAG TPA: hypothetical protein VIV61_02960 [Candidatus Ozemobacteraceae bacterium]
MFPEDLHVVAREICTEIPDEIEFTDRLRAIAERKAELLKGRMGAPGKALEHLPELAFPVVLGAGEQPVVVWETVFTGNIATAFQPAGLDAGPNFARGIEQAGDLIRKRFGDSVDTGILCPATHLFGLATDGSSGSLAMWAALWLSVMGIRVPGGALAVTGKLDASGLVEGVADTEMKAKIALSCGFPHVVVPSADLEKGPAWMKRDSRIIGVRSCDQFHEWLLLADPEYSARGKLFHVARGVCPQKLLPASDAIRPLVAADLEAGTWMDTWRNLRRVARESPRGGSASRWQTVVEACRTALGNLLEENLEVRISRKRWFGLFRAIVPESVFLLHLPLLLERFGRHERALADQLYVRLGHRFADQDLQLDLALKWGTELFTSPALSPGMRDREFRERYPLLSWLLFSDPFAALEAMAGWNPLTPLEKLWWDNIFEGLQRLDPAELANPRNVNRQCLRRILASAARVSSSPGGQRLRGMTLGSWEFRPVVVNETPIDRRPVRMLRILLLSKRLTRAEGQILSRHFRAHIESRHPTETERLLVEDLLQCRRADAEERMRLVQRCSDSALQMLNVCKGVFTKKQRKSRGTRNWICLLQDAWGREAESDPDAAEENRRKRIRSLDISLNRALDNLLTGKIGDAQESAFQFLVNPALALARITLAFEADGRDEGLGNRCLDAWYSFAVNTPLPGLGYRSDLVRECLLHWAGRLTGGRHLPKPSRSLRRSLGLSFWSGFYAADGNQKTLVPMQRLRKWILGAVRNGSPSVIWLPELESLLSPQEWNLLEERLLDHYRAPAKKADKTGREQDLLGLRMYRAAFSKQEIWTVFPADWFLPVDLWKKSLCDKTQRAHTKEEGLVPIGIGWLRGRFPWGLGRRLAGRRGFTPVAPACRELFSPKGRRPFERLLRLLELAKLWQVEWERNIYITIFILQCRYANRWDMVEKVIFSDVCDLANTFLGCDLLKNRGRR